MKKISIPLMLAVFIIATLVVHGQIPAKRPQPKQLDVQFCAEEALSLNLAQKQIHELNDYIDTLEKEIADLKQAKP
jgi:hypothetical protein